MKKKLSLAMTFCIRAEAAPAEKHSHNVIFHIDAPSLAQALMQFSKQTGLQLMLPTGSLENRHARPVVGMQLPIAALEQLLAGTGFDYEFVNEKTVAIRPCVAGASLSASGSAMRADELLNGTATDHSLKNSIRKPASRRNDAPPPVAPTSGNPGPDGGGGGRKLLRLILEAVTVAVLFLSIAGLGAGLDLAVQYLEARGISRFLTVGLKVAEYTIFAADLYLLLRYVLNRVFGKGSH